MNLNKLMMQFLEIEGNLDTKDVLLCIDEEGKRYDIVEVAGKLNETERVIRIQQRN
jgi:type IV secretory pathway VirB4 component